MLEGDLLKFSIECDEMSLLQVCVIGGLHELHESPIHCTYQIPYIWTHGIRPVLLGWACEAGTLSSLENDVHCNSAPESLKYVFEGRLVITLSLA